MAEIKHTFTAGRMNKDLDERLVPNGEYRDALNVQVRTTEGGAAGTIQDILGNELISNSCNAIGSDVSNRTSCVGVVGDERRDRAYFLFASPDLTYTSFNKNILTYWTDSIIEQDSKGTYRHVAIDVWGISETRVLSGNPTANANWTSFNVSSGSKYRVGMQLQGFNSSGNSLFLADTFITRITGNTLHFNKSQPTALSSSCVTFIWKHDKALGFKHNEIITGINVVDDFLFYTTGSSEPKKVNIRRCKDGTQELTSGVPTHTKVRLDTSTGLLEGIEGLVSDEPHINSGDLKAEHLTVIRKAPRIAPALTMSAVSIDGDTSFIIESQSFDIYTTGSYVIVNNVPQGLAITQGDKVKLTCLNDEQGIQSTIVAQVDEIYETNFEGSAILHIISITDDLLAAHTNWLVDLIIEERPLFELKFPKFGFRYKYNDGEYSTFSPWSQVAFLPSRFDYKPKKGYNLGMTNTVRNIKITNLLTDQRFRPDDVKCIDILYKSTDSPTIYVVKTIEKDVDSEWSSTNSTSLSEVIISSEMIHKVVESSQVLRVWDNVPRNAKAQEIIGSRLIYGNYTQGYDLSFNLNLEQYVNSNPITTILKPEKSIKSLRTYKFGTVFGDAYGRETPVIASGTSQESTSASVLSNNSDSTLIPKSSSVLANNFSLKQNWGSSIGNKNAPSAWMDYVKYYIKETSTEYYNLVMDRWYDALDGNVWLSFASSERNKVDEETYLILKNEHGKNDFVEEEARYKVISIKNEAPDFIKTESRNMGLRQLDDGDFGYDSNSVPLGLTNSKQFTLNNNFSDFFGDTSFRGTLKVRIKASTVLSNIYSRYVTVSRLKKPGEDVNGSIEITESFGDEANFPYLLSLTSEFSNVSDAQDAVTYSLEFVDEVLTNKPEFDGRFFVKVQKDLIIEQKVLKAYGSSDDYLKIEAYNLAYVNSSVVNNPATVGSQSNYNFNQGDFTTQADLDTFGAQGGSHIETLAFWSNYLESYQKKGVTAFVDKARAYNGLNGNTADFEPAGSSASGFGKSSDEDVDSDTNDRLFISWIGAEDENEDGQDLETHLTNVGTFFKFTSDPNNAVYMVVAGSSSGKQWNEWSDGSQNPANGNLGSQKKRHSFYTTFRRIDVTNGTKYDEGINMEDWDPRGELKHDGTNSIQIEILEKNYSEGGFENSSSNGAVWETEPKESVDIDIYYEASNAIPLRLNKNNIVDYAPVGSSVSVSRFGIESAIPGMSVSEVYDGVVKVVGSTGNAVTVLQVNDIITFTHADGTKTRSKIKGFATGSDLLQGSYVAANPIVAFKGSILEGLPGRIYVNNEGDEDLILDGMRVEHQDGASNSVLSANTAIMSTALGSYLTINPGASGASSNVTYKAFANGTTASTGYYLIDKEVYKYRVDLPWFNCYSFGNGVESDRIRDDFNSPTIGNGSKVSTTFLDYGEEVRSNGLIYSGLYNANSSFNALNEFNMANKITKDLNPTYGTIQALKTRDTDMTVFTEDKVLKVLANKDALFNADGKTNVTSSNKVLGQAVPYAGDYGISRDPESLAFDQYRMYFTDKQRGAVLRLSRDGLTPISNVGMRSYFREKLQGSKRLIGSFDTVSGEYNLSFQYDDSVANPVSNTISFNEASKGWVSFKSMFPDSGVSIAGVYLTSFQNKIYKHYSTNSARNAFHDQSSGSSSVTFLFNNASGSIKNFKSINYEGSNGYKVNVNDSSNYSDGNYSIVNYESTPIQTEAGWQVTSINTDLNSGIVNGFSKKEGKWFGDIVGDFTVSSGNLVESGIDLSDFATQGLGIPSTITHSTGAGTSYTITIEIE